ncbi:MULTISPECIES: sensor histidine kinase [Pseudanabaena]|uniref:sensor histidine kinase n=1 Tax=Pseudanabaena TaxID=1152 RepID=UPI00247A4E26|nr:MULTISPECIES: HAMP domain-containing sensor histidine kinase [Pseudanabaena]MEA5486945.1 HAMP domain-containing sensor histidine kinase [Pseudanabaena sp. CCNP1317]WGS75069.1 HAMP domain-containing sensor histidine kinase [Pseudanabaena galeata CCNP1313]
MYKSIRNVIANIFKKRVSPNSLQFRLTVELIAMSVISLTGVSVWAGWKMEQTVVNGHKQMLEYVAMRFPDQVEMYMETGGVKAGIERTSNKVATSDLAILVKGDNGEVIAKSANNYDLSADLQNIGYTEVPTTPQVIQIGDRYVVMCGNNLTVNGKLVGKVYLSQDVTNDQLQLNNGLYGLIIVSISATVILIVAIALRIRKALSPLQEMSQMASVISIDDLSDAKLELAKAPDEILGLAQTFNEMLQRLSSAWEQQRQFVGNVSHELRTPLTVICGYLQSLLRRGDNLSIYQKQAIETASAETERTIQMLQDLLDLARADSGNLHFRQAPVFLNTLVAEVAAMSAKVSDRSVTAIVQDQDIVALADQDRLQQVLINLVDNAIKYSADPVEIQMETREDQAMIHVCDRGIGIALVHQHRVFERFYRSDDPSTRSRDGTGLGLAIAKSLVEGMNGKISLMSKPNEGSIFTISLPLWNPQR